MILEIGNFTEKLVLSEFKLTSTIDSFKTEGPPVFLSTKITVYLPQFHLTINSYITLEDLKCLKIDISKIINGSSNQLYFENIDRNIIFQMSIIPSGQLTIFGQIFNSNKSADLHFEIESERKYLDLMIERLGIIITEFDAMLK